MPPSDERDQRPSEATPEKCPAHWLRMTIDRASGRFVCAFCGLPKEPEEPRSSDALTSEHKATIGPEDLLETSGNNSSPLSPVSAGAENLGRIPPGSNAGGEGVTAGRDPHRVPPIGSGSAHRAVDEMREEALQADADRQVRRLTGAGPYRSAERVSAEDLDDPKKRRLPPLVSALGPLDMAEAHVRSALDGDDVDENLAEALEQIQHARREHDDLRGRALPTIDRGRLSEEELDRIERHIRSARHAEDIWTTPAEALAMIAEIRDRRRERARETSHEATIVDEPYDSAGTPGRACTACKSAWPTSEPDGEPWHHADGCPLAKGSGR